MKLSDPIKYGLDWSAFWLGMGAFIAKVVPPLVGLVSLIWLLLQIYEWIIDQRWKASHLRHKRKSKRDE